MENLHPPDGDEFDEFARWAIRCADEIAARYLQRSRFPHRFPRSGDDIHKLIDQLQNELGRGRVKAAFLEKGAPFDDPTFLGLLVRKLLDHWVYLNPYLEPPAMRLALTQESFQALLHDKRLEAAVLSGALTNFCEFLIHRNWDAIEPTTFGELIAEIAAMQALFPLKLRLSYFSSDPAAPTTLHFRVIAKRFGIPEQWARFYLRSDVVAYFTKLQDPL